MIGAAAEIDGSDRDAALAERLVREGRIEASAAERAARLSERTGEPLPSVLLKLGLLAERDLAEALAALHALPLIGADDWPDVLPFDIELNPRFLREARVLPLARSERGVLLAMADPADSFTLGSMQLMFSRPVLPAVATPGAIERAIDRLFAEPEAAEAEPEETEAGSIALLRDQASEAPVIRIVNRMISRAIDLRASDIHLEAPEGRLRLRYRIDGVLSESEPPPPALAAAIVSRIKIVAGLNIAERRLPQDGRIKIVVRGTPVDLRVATVPTLHGESVVLRVLDREAVALDFDALGLAPGIQSPLIAALERPNGIFLITGPTGSGKTTTLYAALARLNDAGRKIITVEDPVEYQLEGVNQIPVRAGIGLDFAAALRAILRQDPDIILVGEIRDVETAEIAAQAALTGHLVLSTLHTNSAAASVTRLMDMGLAPYLIAATLNGAAAQRLVRRLCPDCREGHPADPDLLLGLGVAPAEGRSLWRAVGCRACNGTGYRGRLALMEVLALDEELSRRIVRGEGDAGLEAAARAAGMRSLRADGLDKALAGLTSLEEVLRVTRDG